MANQVVAGTNAGYDLSEEIRKQKAAELESALAALKGAYDKSMGSLDSAQAKLPQTYEAARNEVAAESARSARAFDERAMAAGLNTVPLDRRRWPEAALSGAIWQTSVSRRPTPGASWICSGRALRRIIRLLWRRPERRVTPLWQMLCTTSLCGCRN